MLKSIIAQLEFKHQIVQWDAKGVPFRQHLHVPETHPITGEMFCEREDEGHVFKVWFQLTLYAIHPALLYVMCCRGLLTH